MSGAAPKTPLAVSADLDPDRRAEIIHGAIVEKAAPTFEHSHAQSGALLVLKRRFGRKPGGRWPGGCWIGTEVHLEYRAHELYCHDVVGWRRDRVPDPPSGWPVRIRPDWVCEILSRRHEKRDLVDKLHVLHAAAVPHYWVVDPEEKMLLVHRHSAAGYVLVLTAGADETVRAEPFDAVEIRVAVLLGDEDDED